MDNNKQDPDTKKTWIEKINLYINLICEIFAILGISVASIISTINNTNNITKPYNTNTPLPQVTASINDNTEAQNKNEVDQQATPLPTTHFSYAKYICITAKTVNVKNRPNKSSKKVGVLHSGDMAYSLYETTGENGEIWHRIITGRINGYIPSKCVQIINSDEERYIQLIDGITTLNVRDYPKPDAYIISQISEEYKYQILEEVKGVNNELWYKILIDDKTKGYVDSRFVKVVE